jgi:hypothetical protein
LTYDHADRPPTLDEILEWKEYFIYEVRFGFVKLGEVRTEVVQDTTHAGDKLWWLRSKIISNPSVPFVGKEENHYNTFFVQTDTLPHTQLYWRDNVDEQEYNDERYRFEYDQQKVYVSEDEELVDTLEVTEPASAGQLVLVYSRLFAGSERDYSLPVYLEREMGYIDATNDATPRKREYDAFEEPVETFYSEGSADIDGPFGFKGKFRAWFIADDLRVPAEVHARVWLGNVKVKLVDYQKEPRK